MSKDADFERADNFFAGPAVLPEPVLNRVREEFINFKNMNLSVIEISHRSKQWEETVDGCLNKIRNILGVPENYQILFLQGGASTQFGMIPMNIASRGGPVQLVHTGVWSKKKLAELEIQNIDHEIIASSEETGFDRVPKFDPAAVNPRAEYFHICSNETIGGVQWQEYPETGEVPLVADMSSDIMSRPLDVSKFGLIYAGAQKNIGPAGVTMVIIREDLVERVTDDVPTMLRYATHVKKNSMHNTPPVFAIYVVDMVMDWLIDQGGVQAMERRNAKKSEMIYELIDEGDFYAGAAEAGSRSAVNITFRLPEPELGEKFISEAAELNMLGLKGHRSVGGCRASMYNSLPVESAKKLADFMREFRQKNG